MRIQVLSRPLAVVLLALLATGCSTAPGATAGPTLPGGATAVRLCDAQQPGSLSAAVAQLDSLGEADDPAPLLAVLGTTLGDIEQLSLEPASELVSWRDASADAIRQIQARVSDPSRRAALYTHASRTLGLFEDRLCP
jgi:hypothetical protein